MLRNVLIVLFVTAFAFNAVAEEVTCTTDPSCIMLDQIEQATAEEPVDLTLVQLLLQAFFVLETTQEPAILPFWTYPEGIETEYLAFTAQAQFGEGLSEYINQTMLDNVWNAIYNKFELEIDTYRNGMGSLNQMVDYLFASGGLTAHLFKSTVKSKMAAYNPPYLEPAAPITTPPLPSNVTYLEDFQNTNGKIVSWPRFNTEVWEETGRLIKAFSDDGLPVYVVVGNQYWARAAMYYLQYKTGMSVAEIMEDVQFIELESDWVNAGDWAPYFATSGTDKLAMCPGSGVPWAPTTNDNLNCIRLAEYFGIPAYQIMYTDDNNQSQLLYLEGSNFLTDGDETAIIGPSIFTFNEGLDMASLEASLAEYLGIEEVIIASELGETTSSGQINAFIALIENTAIVGSSYFWLTAELDATATQLANEGFDVLRIPLPLKTDFDLTGITARSYTNVAVTDSTVFMPAFGDFWHPLAKEQDDTAAAVYESLGLNVVRVKWQKQPACMVGYSSSNIPWTL